MLFFKDFRMTKEPYIVSWLGIQWNNLIGFICSFSLTLPFLIYKINFQNHTQSGLWLQQMQVENAESGKKIKVILMLLSE